MDHSIPVFPSFQPDLDKADVSSRWKKWLTRLENLFDALDITQDKRKRALLLHYAGEQVHDIFDAESGLTATHTSQNTADTSTSGGGTSSSGTQPDPGTYAGASALLTNYFAPKRNKHMEVYTFRSCKQRPDQPLEDYVTELRRLAQSCSFSDPDNEILCQLIQHCSSKRLRRRALMEPQKSLTDIVQLGRMLEEADRQAEEMETSNLRSVSALNPRPGQQQRYKQPAPKQRPRNATCRNCGGPYPHDGQCPAFGKLCNFCSKPNHFESVCRSKRRLEKEQPPVRNPGKRLNAVSETVNDDNADDYLFQVSAVNNSRPKTEILVAGVSLQMLLDTGASVNVIDQSSYQRLGKPPMTGEPVSPIFPYGGDTPLPVLGVCRLETCQSGHPPLTLLYHIVEGSHGNILGFDASTELGLIHVVRELDQWQQSFPLLSKGIGKLKGRKFALHINKDIRPVAITNRRTPFHLRGKVEDELNKLLADDIIEAVSGEPTPWVSPIVTPPKKDGSIRLCVDMREPNKAIQRERHCMPTTEELIHDLNGAVLFSKIDLRAGYHQLELETESRYITTFSTHKGLYRYKRLSFGISSASEIFQHAIHEVIRDVKGAKNISDDIICFGRGPDAKADHDRAVRETLTRLQDSGLTVNWPKCEFGVKQIGFFGLVFSENGVSPDPKKVQAAHSAAPPENASQVRSFLGMLNYSARFIQDYATVSEPLRRLMNKDAEFEWGPEQARAFQTLKDRLTDSYAIAFYDPSAPIEVLTDASPVGLGAILAQNDKVVAYASRALTNVESRYSQTEREALAVVWACEHFDMYLRGAPTFDVITDHKPLVTIWSKPRPPLRIERWGLRLQPYKAVIKYRRGCDNPADYMSRHPVVPSKTSIAQDVAEQYVHFIAAASTPNALSLTKIAEESSKDHTLMKAIDLLQSGKWHEVPNIDEPDVDKRELQEYRNVRDELTFHTAGVLLRGPLIVIPASLRRHVVELAHEGHQGMSRTKAFIRSKVWFPGINAAVEAMIQRCVVCQAVQTTPTPMEPLRMSPMPPGPWHDLSMDFCGPLPSGDYLMVIIDEYSRYPVVEILKSVSAAVVLPVLDKVLSIFGFPQIIKTDNGSPFNSTQFAKYAEHCGFKHRRITPHWPRANAQAESFNKPLMKAVRAAHMEQKNWKQEMFRFLRQYRSTPHSSTGVTPYRLLFGREPMTRIPQVSRVDEVVQHDVGNGRQAPQPTSIIDQRAAANDAKAKEKQKTYADQRNHARSRHLAVGDHVMVRRDSRGNKLSSVFHPFTMVVVAVKGNMITAEGKYNRVTRNVSYFKRVTIDDSSRDIDDHVVVDDDAIPIPSQQPTQKSPAAVAKPPPRRRIQRHRRPPSYLRDYVVK